MIRGLYTSASGMLAEMVRNDVTSNNLANVNTTGYKKDTAIFKSFPEMLIQRIYDNKAGEPNNAPVIGSLGTGAVVDEVFTNYEQGPLKETSNPFDLAIQGEGYFVVQNANGTFYTRNGSFTLDGQGYLVNSDGAYLMGQNGRIRIGNADNVVVDEAGNVSENGNRIDTIRTVTIANQNDARKIGDSLFTSQQATNGITGSIKQKFLEASNVNVVNEMVSMITVMRAYEANQKIISAHDQTLEQAIQVGSVK